MTAIDASANMLAKANNASTAQASDITLEVGDVQHLKYGNDSFDPATATCVFCSVADPVAGLREVAVSFGRTVRSCYWSTCVLVPPCAVGLPTGSVG